MKTPQVNSNPQVNSQLNQISFVFSALSKKFVSKEEEIKTLLLGYLSQENTLLIGPPGTAKSALVREFASLLGKKFFMYLLTKYTEPAELFGALDLNALKQGVHKRITKDRLPEAQIAFLDEIFKANSAILNALLSLLNERVIYDGYNTIRVPLELAVGASNEIPEDEELRALYDRFVIRRFTNYVQENKLTDLLTLDFSDDDDSEVPQTLNLDNLREEVKVRERKIKQNKELIGKIAEAVIELRKGGIFLSDRTIVKIPKLMSAISIINLGSEPTTDDLADVLVYLAGKEDDINKINDIVDALKLRSGSEALTKLREMENEINNLLSRIDEAKKNADSLKLNDITNMKASLISLMKAVNSVLQQYGNQLERYKSTVQEVVVKLERAQKELQSLLTL